MKKAIFQVLDDNIGDLKNKRIYDLHPKNVEEFRRSLSVLMSEVKELINTIPEFKDVDGKCPRKRFMDYAKDFERNFMMLVPSDLNPTPDLKGWVKTDSGDSLQYALKIDEFTYKITQNTDKATEKEKLSNWGGNGWYTNIINLRDESLDLMMQLANDAGYQISIVYDPQTLSILLDDHTPDQSVLTMCELIFEHANS